MEDRDQERRFLTSRIEELERLDASIKGSITKEKTQYNMIAARDSLIEDLSKRYEQMREDFKYNLDLIEHRDSEISRLSRLRKVDKTELNEKELEIKSMANRLNVFERQEYEMKENIDAERAQFKNLLTEIKDEMEDVKVATSEEGKCKKQEVERLQAEIKKLSQSRTDALEHQRGDLIATYEQLMKQREEVYHKRENEIVTMISVLENKFETIQTEALHLKAELRNTQTMYEQANNELQLKGDQLRTLQYKNDDDSKEHVKELATANNRITELTAGLDHEKLVACNEISSGKAEISKLTMQLAHETQRFTDLERNYTEYRQFNELEAERQGVHVQGAQEKLERVVEEERRRAEEASAKLLSTTAQVLEVDRELSQSRAECKSVGDELEHSKETVRQLQIQLGELKNQTQRQEHELQAERQQCESRLAELKETHNQTLLASIASAEASKNHDLALLRNSMELTNSNLVKDHDRHAEALLSEHEQRNKEFRQEVENWKSKAADANKLLDAEKSECTVLRLRLQALQVSSHLPAQQQRNQSLAALGTNASMNNDSMYLPSIPPLTGNSSIDSPMFRSQQLGRGVFGEQSPQPQRYSANFSNSGTSFLDSPLIVPPEPPAVGEEGGATKPSTTSSLFNDQGGDNGSFSGPPTGGADDSNLMSVVNENEELRNIIKQMRNEVESMHQQQHRTSMSMIESDTMGNYDILETRLRQTTAEVSRLHKERRRLIDISNSLQAQVNNQSKNLSTQKEIERVQEPPDAPEEDNVGPIGQLAASLNASRQTGPKQRASIAVMGSSSAIYSAKPNEKPAVSMPTQGVRRTSVGNGASSHRRASTSSIRSGKPVIRNYALGDT